MIQQGCLFILWFSPNPCKWQTPRPTMLFFYHCMSSCSWFTAILISKHSNNRFYNSWAKAVASLCVWFQVIFQSKMQWSDWRWFSSSTHNCKITVRIHSLQVSQLLPKDSRAAGICPKNCHHLKYFQSFDFTTNEHKLCYFTIFYSSLSHLSTHFLECGSKHWHCCSKPFGDLACSQYSLVGSSTKTWIIVRLSVVTSQVPLKDQILD